MGLMGWVWILRWVAVGKWFGEVCTLAPMATTTAIAGGGGGRRRGGGREERGVEG